MTLKELDKANELQKEIQTTAEIGYLLERTIDEEKKSSFQKLFIRFLNAPKRRGGSEEARVIFFRSLGAPIDFPVDMEFLEYLLAFFEKRFKEKQAEFDALCVKTED